MNEMEFEATVNNLQDIAAFIKVYYDSLLALGFTPYEALVLASSYQHSTLELGMRTSNEKVL